MILEQYYLGCLAHASYLVADEQSRTAAIVDPQRDVDQYLRDAHRLGIRIRHVFLTHFHADFVAGHLELRDREGATIYLGASARAEYEFVPLGEGDAVELGPEVRLDVLETPGHSPESISILVNDLVRDADAPHAVLIGDTLFIGDVGRPDLRASLGWSAEELAGLLYDSLREKLLRLPDATLVYPAHGAGSLCGKNLGTETVSTIGVQRRSRAPATAGASSTISLRYRTRSLGARGRRSLDVAPLAGRARGPSGGAGARSPRVEFVGRGTAGERCGDLEPEGLHEPRVAPGRVRGTIGQARTTPEPAS